MAGNRASEDLTLQVANAMVSLAALRFRGPCGTADQREGMACAGPLERRAVYTRVLGAAADCGEIHPVDRYFPGEGPDASWHVFVAKLSSLEIRAVYLRTGF